ncbi:macrosialin [Lampris incognitus]|uniref:macrosialin n=1 Tax=Lampris incognitus TaxID=2546036 RepID=UPI0024B4DEC3|nr:macrosialin [Lampris incognitus]
MKKLLVSVVLVVLVSALSSAGENKRSKPPATVSPASESNPTTANKTSTATTTATTVQTTGKTTATTHTKPNTTATTHTTPPTTAANTTTTHTTPPTTAANTTTTHTTPHTPAANTTTTHTTPHTPAANTTTTHTPPHTTTTEKPKTTTTKPPTPAPPRPTSPTNLTDGNYSVTNEKNVTCLMAQMALQIRLARDKVNGTYIVQPKRTQAVGGCLKTAANLTLTFTEGAITFLFNKDVTEDAVYVNALSFKLTYPFSSAGQNVYTANNKSVHLFAAKIGHSYSCRSESLYMGDGLYLDVLHSKMQAFNLTSNKGFGFPDPCPADVPDNTVAIAVGVTLLLLIIIVLVAYALGRRRRGSGYQSL